MSGKLNLKPKERASYETSAKVMFKTSIILAQSNEITCHILFCNKT